MTRWLMMLLVILLVVVFGSWGWRRVMLAEAPVAPLDVSAEPMHVTVDAERLEAALDAAPWVSPDGDRGGTLWVVGHRSCLACVRYLRSEAPTLDGAGVDLRVIFFAPDDAGAEERAVLAEIGARRDWPTLRAYVEGDEAGYYARTNHPVAVDPVRAAIITAGRRARDEIADVMAANGYETVYPLLFWRDGTGGWRATMDDTTRGRNAVRDALLPAAGAS